MRKKLANIVEEKFNFITIKLGGIVVLVGIILSFLLAFQWDIYQENNTLNKYQKSWEQFLLSGDVVSLRAQLNYFVSLRSWKTAIVLDAQKQIFSSYPDKHNVGRVSSEECENRFDVKNNEGKKIGAICWQRGFFSSGQIIFFPIILIIVILYLLQLILQNKIKMEIVNQSNRLSLLVQNLKKGEIPIDDEERELNQEEYEITLAIKNFVLQKENLKKIEIEAKEKNVLVGLASQISHDIRSPLAALNVIMDELNDIPEKNRIIIRSSVNRINDIANQLLEKGKTKKVDQSVGSNDLNEIKLSVELLSPLIDSLVSQKRIQFREKQGVEIWADINLGYGLFANINPTELHRTLSNILNNSIEAMPSFVGKVSLDLKSDQDNIFLMVKDNGKGIPAHILEKLGEMGVSHGKEGTQSGSGLGIYHAKKTIESFGGKFEISSVENLGTTITMSFPKASAPKWFVEKLLLPSGIEVISLDDDLSIHQIWQGRFESLNTPIKHLTFTSGTEFKKFVENENKKRIYLVDFELLNQNQTGLEIITELNIGPQSILVTSRYEEDLIRSACQNLGVKLIPKAMAGFVPIEIETPKRFVDIILIDDDELIHLVWESQAKKNHKSFVDFYRFEDFLKIEKEFDFNSTIYIDSNLKDGVKGEEVSKIAFELGFKNIYLCTGYEADTFPSMPWIKGIMGKELKF